MRLKKWVSACIATSSLLVTVTAMAAQFQAGDIQVGDKVKLDANSGVASYYATGKKGLIEFNCTLESTTNNKVKAWVYPGKNFDGTNGSAFLEEGKNGPYRWRLSDRGDDVGNIKVQLLGTEPDRSAYVQCQGLFVVEPPQSK